MSQTRYWKDNRRGSGHLSSIEALHLCLCQWADHQEEAALHAHDAACSGSVRRSLDVLLVDFKHELRRVQDFYTKARLNLPPWLRSE